jgi:hypothetical protein
MVSNLSAFKWALLFGLMSLSGLKAQAEQWDVVAIPSRSKPVVSIFFDPP